MSISNIVNQFVKQMVVEGELARRTILIEYQKLHHVMRKNDELLIPSKNEMYTFYKKEGWKVLENNDEIVKIMKESKEYR